jgi:multiple sugar transport system substrate-binding protein
VLESKRFLRAVSLIAGLSLLGLTGCGNSTVGSGGQKTSTSKTITVAYYDFGTSGPPLKRWLTKAASQLQAKYKDAKIKLEPITASSEQDYYTKIDLMMRNSKTSPDVVYEDSFLIGPDASAGYLQPIPNIQQWSGWNSYYPAMQNIVKYNQKVYGAMASTDVQAIYYNKKLFAKAGLPVPWQPKNWQDVLNSAKAIKASDTNVVPMWLYTGQPLGEASSFRGFEIFLDGTQDNLYNYNTKKWITSGPGFNKVFNFLKQVHDLGLEEPETDWSNPNGSSIVNLQLMPQQKVGIVFDGNWVGGNYLSTGAKPWPQAFQSYGVAKIPTADGQAPGFTNQSGGWALSLAAKSQNPKLATEFIKIAASQDNLASLDSETGNVPPRKDVATNPTIEKTLQQNLFLKQTIDLVQNSKFRPSVGTQYTQISDVIATLTGQISMGQIDAKQAAQLYAEQVTQIVGKDNVESH